MKRAGEGDIDEDRDRQRPRHDEKPERRRIMPLPELEWELVKTMTLIDYLELLSSLPAHEHLRDEILMKFYRRDFSNYFNPAKELDFARRLRTIYEKDAKNKLDLYTLAGFLMRYIMVATGLGHDDDYYTLDVGAKPDHTPVQGWVDAIAQAPRRRYHQEALLSEVPARPYVSHMCARHLYEPPHPPGVFSDIGDYVLAPDMAPFDGPQLIKVPDDTVKIGVQLYGESADVHTLVPLPGSVLSVAREPGARARNGWVEGLPPMTFVDKETGVPAFAGQMTLRFQPATPYGYLDVSVCFLNVDYFTDLFASWMEDVVPVTVIARKLQSGLGYLTDEKLMLPETFKDFVSIFFFPLGAERTSEIPSDDASIREAFPLSLLMEELAIFLPRLSALGDKDSQRPLLYFEDRAPTM